MTDYDIKYRMGQGNEGEVQAAKGRQTYQSRLDFGGGRIYLVRVIVDESTTPPSVIAAHRTSKIAKYWRGEL